MSRINTAKQLEEQLKPLEKQLRYEQELKLLFSNKSLSEVRTGFTLMKDQLTFVAEGKQIKPSTNQVNKIARVSSILIDVMIERPVTEYYQTMMPQYIDLLNNWNRQVGKSNGITRNVKIAKRIIDSQMTMNDSIRVMKNLLRKLRAERTYRPAAYDLSKHYLLELQKNIADNIKNKEE